MIFDMRKYLLKILLLKLLRKNIIFFHKKKYLVIYLD